MVKLNKMAQLVKSQTVVTKDGECNINISLDLNIHLDSSGLSLSVNASETDKNKQRVMKQDDEQVDWASVVPDFTNKPEKKNLFKFGKKV
jgi:hypothetical protein